MVGCRSPQSRNGKQVSPVYRTNRLTMTRRVGISSAVAIGVLVTGAGIAGASTHHQSKIDGPLSVTAPPRTDQARGLGGLVGAVTGTSITVRCRNGTSTRFTIGSTTTVAKDVAAALLTEPSTSQVPRRNPRAGPAPRLLTSTWARSFSLRGPSTPRTWC
jgi:hypothetical protein